MRKLSLKTHLLVNVVAFYNRSDMGIVKAFVSKREANKVCKIMNRNIPGDYYRIFSADIVFTIKPQKKK